MSDALLSDDASQGSQRSALTGSLLERIRAQREAQQRTAAAPASTVEVPSFSRFGNDEQLPTNNRWSLNVAWPTMGLAAHDNEDASEALLSRDSGDDQSYSMGQYLKTFLQDFYNGFRSMHPVVQVVVVLLLLYVAFKLV
jgi:hypothetical protein